MATVYSLVCWGGLTGKTVSISASTDLVTLTNNGVKNAIKLWPSGSLPAELNVLTPVYARNVSINTFSLHPTAADALAGTNQILFSGASTYSAVILKSDLIVTPARLAAYGVTISRYGSPGSERIYDGLSAANGTRSTVALGADDEIIEFGEAFDEYSGPQVLGAGFAQSYTFTSLINGIRTTAFHFGLPSAGYTYTSNAATCFYTNQINVTADGLDWIRNSTSTSTNYYVVSTTYGGNIFCNNIVRNVGTGLSNGIQAYSAGSRVYNNIVIGVTPGNTAYGGIAVFGGAIVYNNTVTKCGAGLIGFSNGASYGQTYNNLSVGNTVNYGPAPIYTATRAGGNIGEITDLRTFTVSGTNITLSAAPTVGNNQQVFLSSTGTLPSVGGVPLLSTRSYYIRSISGSVVTIGTVYNGAALTFSDAGTGTHTMSMVWATDEAPANYIDFSDPSLVFKDWANNDLRPAGTGATPAAQAKMVDAAKYFSFADTTTDIVGLERPNYNGGGAEFKDVGAFEYDRGYGPRPNLKQITIVSQVSLAGAEVRIYDLDSATPNFYGTELAGVESAPGSTYVYSGQAGNVIWIQILKDGYEEFGQQYTIPAVDSTFDAPLVPEYNI